MNIENLMKNICDNISHQTNKQLDSITASKALDACKKALIENKIIVEEEWSQLRFNLVTGGEKSDMYKEYKRPSSSLRLEKYTDVTCVGGPPEKVQRVNSFLESCDLEKYISNDD